MRSTTGLACAAAVLALLVLFEARPGAYLLHGSRWMESAVGYVVNGTNLDLPAAAAIAAVRAGADTWMQQSGASFAFVYQGASTQSTNTYDGINLVSFRDEPNGSTIATTYWWYSGDAIIDADIVFWDGGHKFFAGSSGCSAGFYIEDIAAHEFGHALGLGHSTISGTTMYPSTSSCNQSPRSLHNDDIAGVRALYPPQGLPLTPSGLRIVH
jgi:hypothetical protein